MTASLPAGVRERPLLMSGPMVCATLRDVDPKTQTRRVIDPQPNNPQTFGISPIWGWGVHKENAALPGAKPGRFCVHAAFTENGKRVDRFLPCPYGVVGDRLWVRETFALVASRSERFVSSLIRAGAGRSLADMQTSYPMVEYRADEAKLPAPTWHPSIHMPRWACRLVLEITELRVERVQDISAQDAIAEGIEVPGLGEAPTRDRCVERYRQLWDSINAERGYGWDVNPWVFVISLRRL